MFFIVVGTRLYVAKDEIVKFLMSQNKTCPLSELERGVCEKGFSREEVIQAYNHLIFDNRITCNGETVCLSELK